MKRAQFIVKSCAEFIVLNLGEICRPVPQPFSNPSYMKTRACQIAKISGAEPSGGQQEETPKAQPAAGDDRVAGAEKPASDASSAVEQRVSE